MESLDIRCVPGMYIIGLTNPFLSKTTETSAYSPSSRLSEKLGEKQNKEKKRKKKNCQKKPNPKQTKNKTRFIQLIHEIKLFFISYFEWSSIELDHLICLHDMYIYIMSRWSLTPSVQKVV